MNGFSLALYLSRSVVSILVKIGRADVESDNASCMPRLQSRTRISVPSAIFDSAFRGIKKKKEVEEKKGEERFERASLSLRGVDGKWCRA